MENPIRMDDLGVPLFSETSISTAVTKKRCFPILDRLPTSGRQRLVGRRANEMRYGHGPPMNPNDMI